MSEFMVIVHVVPLELWQPSQFPNVLAPTLAGATSVTVVPAAYSLSKVVDPLPWPLTSLGETEMFTPLPGLDEATLSMNREGAIVT